MKPHRCPVCGKPESCHEVKIKNKVKEYFICWPCYDKKTTYKAYDGMEE